MKSGQQNRRHKKVDANAEISQDSRQPMINSIHIENFRCFQKLGLKDFGKFNIIVGENGSGKTALLEAIFLPGNSADVPVVYRNQRGMISPGFSPEKQAYEAMFSDLFFGFSTDLPIEIKIVGSYENLRSARIYFKPITERPLLPEGELKNGRVTDRLFTLQTKDADNKESIQQVNLKGLISAGGEHKQAIIAFVTTGTVGSAHVLAQLLSDIRKNNADGQIQEAVHELFPGISDLSPELTGGLGEIHCKVAGLSKKVPVTLVSHGINKVLCILLFIATHRGGAVLVDEIDNGIYYKAFPKMWEAIIRFCNDFNVQFFASTHSKECLNELRPFIEKNQDMYRLVRTEGENGAGHTARIFKGENFSAALETGTEVR
ncbi:MAG: AAA family ATPase [Verrucomicrobiota bacterium]|jgi:AAA15 family ATPase/GTPase